MGNEEKQMRNTIVFFGIPCIIDMLKTQYADRFTSANWCLWGDHCRGGSQPPARYNLTMTKQVGRIRTNLKCLSHATPCLQGEGRVGIRGRQWVAIKAPANS